ncbi:MAG: PIN domain-containing protein [Candidatus Beckwithbacteria bacterium]|nr:PIN domain-containing protein [Patescibacteria group bacterium]
MREELLDTNIITRFFIGDVKAQHNKAEEIFREAKLGRRNLRLESLVVAEVCFVLESFYKRERQEIAQFLSVFSSQGWLRVRDKNIIQASWQWYLKGFHFVDSYLIAWSKVNKGKILTFDKKLSKMA